MASDPNQSHDIEYDGKTHELYKIYLLNLLLSILTLGLYHFWGKTRKRRYITSSFQLDGDRFEYTGYGKELFFGLLLGIVLLGILSLPLIWSCYKLDSFKNQPVVEENAQTESKNDTQESLYHIEQYDHFKQNKFIVDYKSPTDFWLVFKNNGLLFNYKNSRLDLWVHLQGKYAWYELPLTFYPKKDPILLTAVLLIPLYLILYIFFFPFIIVYGSLRYRVSRLRWRGIRGHLNGSALVYGIMGFIQTALKIITLGLWIPISDLKMIKYKVRKLYFGNQRATFTPCLKRLFSANLATIGASLYIIGLMAACGHWILPLFTQFAVSNSWIVHEFTVKVLHMAYILFLMILVWGCYAPRYWYRAALLRERYNALKFGNIGFVCRASGFQYLKLFVINDLIFILTLGFGMPFIWQRRMTFFCKHVKVTGNLKELNIEQAPGKKSKFGGGFASVMNLEIGLI